MYEHREEIPMTVWFRIAFWGFMFAGKLYTINYICENVSVKVKKLYNAFSIQKYVFNINKF